MDYELIIVGGGPAGLSAALSAAYYNLKTLVLESGSAGGALVTKYPWKKVDEFLGQPNVIGHEAAMNMLNHVREEGVDVLENHTVKDVKKEGDELKVVTSRKEYTCKAVILGIGLGVPRKLGLEGEHLEGVHYSLKNPTGHKGVKVLVAGGGDTALENALALAENNAEVTLIHRGDKFRAKEKTIKEIEESKVNVLMETQVKDILGNGKVEKVILTTPEGEETKDYSFILLNLGTVAHKEFLEKIKIKTDEKGNIIVDDKQRTNIEGVFAAGDAVGKWLRIPNAIGEGGFAALNAFKYIKNPYWA